MLNKKIGNYLAAAGVALCSVIFTGCAGGSQSDSTENLETTTNPPFEMPGESVMEATMASSYSEEPSLPEESSESESTSSQTQSGETVWISTESSEEETTTAQPVTSDTNHVVVLDPGHGGTWLGAVDGTYYEKNLALQTALYCRDYLVNNYEDVTVYLTRDTDMEFSYDQKQDLEERVKIAKSYNAEILVSLHFNSEPTDASNGSLVCISKQSWVNGAATALGNSILDQLSQLGLTNKGLLVRDSDEYFDEYGAAMDYYAICRHSASFGFPGVIVEHCFMRNAVDVSYYSTDEALQRLGQADAIGIAQYLGLQQQQ
jgi:N-acetylmuramoyl-L-alanine amidase